MGRVTKTELNQQTARVLARVSAGERITVTERGLPIAEITPAAPSRWDELVAAGRVTLARADGPLSVAPVDLDVPTADLLDDVREDRA